MSQDARDFPLPGPRTTSRLLRSRSFSMFETLQIYLRLVKFRLVLLVLVSCAAGYVMASGTNFLISSFLLVVLGSGLQASGALALNQWMEHEYDAKMLRTAARPLPAGDLSRSRAFTVGAALILMGSAVLYWGVNAISLNLGILTVIFYLIFYTPMKRRTSLCVYFGAVSGALPPLIGWAGASGTFPPAAWALFAMLFFWQIEHFSVIAWMYREDYRRAGFVLSEIRDVSGVRTSWKSLIAGVLLAASSLIPTAIGFSGWGYAALSLFLGSILVYFHALSVKRGMPSQARRLMGLSILYLFALLLAMMIDKMA